MIVYGLDGKQYDFEPKNWIRRKKRRKNVSSLHKQARKLLKKTFKNYPIYEEILLPGCKIPGRQSSLYVDFLIPHLRIIVEVQGQQHYKYVSHFHGNKFNYIKSQYRDKAKKEWCAINDFILIELPYDKVAEWPKILENRWDQ